MITKTVVFLRGSCRKEALDIMLPILNNAPNHVYADVVSMDDYHTEAKAGKAKSCRNRFTHCLVNPMRILIVDNENFKSSHWDPYLLVIEQMKSSRRAVTLGYHFGDEDNNLDSFKEAMDLTVINHDPESIALQILDTVKD